MKILHDKKRFFEVVAGPGGGLSLLDFFLSLAFQTGYFSLPTFPKETQQLHICTPVTQTNVTHSVSHRAAEYFLFCMQLQRLLSRQLKNSLK